MQLQCFILVNCYHKFRGEAYILSFSLEREEKREPYSFTPQKKNKTKDAEL